MMRQISNNFIEVSNPAMEFDWKRLHDINPKTIKLAFSNAIPYTAWNKVYDGDWDDSLPIEQDFVYDSVTKYLTGQLAWKDTELYKKSIECINHGISRWSCTSIAEFDKRETHILNINSMIQMLGFKTQPELFAMGLCSWANDFDCSGAVIDRHGRYLYHNGNHRLPMFILNNINPIKLRINVRHKLWVDFLVYADKVFQSIWPVGTIYQPIEHVDFSHYRTEWSDYRYNIIANNISSHSKTLLDIGSLLGYFCFKFTDLGLTCTGVELNHDFERITRQLQLAKCTEFELIRDSVFNLPHYKYDIVLALNIFHHFLKTKDSFDQFTAMLSKLDINEMYFQPHNPDEHQMANAYRNYSPIDFVQFIINNSCLTSYTILGQENGRNLFKLWR